MLSARFLSPPIVFPLSVLATTQRYLESPQMTATNLWQRLANPIPLPGHSHFSYWLSYGCTNEVHSNIPFITGLNTVLQEKVDSRLRKSRLLAPSAVEASSRDLAIVFSCIVY